MILIGMFDSPFVRRVAVSMNLLEMPFEHRNWSVGKDFELIRQFNPLGRVPALVQADGESLIDSTAILDFLDDAAGPERALLPRSGQQRRDALKVVAIALGAGEKGLQQLHEILFKPETKRHDPWMDRCRHQMNAALGELDRLAQTRSGAWMVGDRLTQADITATCIYTYLCDALGLRESWLVYPGLSALASRCEALPAFAQVRAKFDPPTPYAESTPNRGDAVP
jgi:glutathione S-transferase